MPIQKDYYILALEYGDTHSQFTFQELTNAIGLNDEQEKAFALQIHNKQIFSQDSSNYIGSYDKDPPIKLSFSIEDKFRLLNFIALQEARESSKSATLFAGCALTVSIFSLLVSAYFSYLQLNSPINIPAAIVAKIDRIVTGQSEVNKYVVKFSDVILKEHVEKDRNISSAKQK